MSPTRPPGRRSRARRCRGRRRSPARRTRAAAGRSARSRAGRRAHRHSRRPDLLVRHLSPLLSRSCPDSARSRPVARPTQPSCAALPRLARVRELEDVRLHRLRLPHELTTVSPALIPPLPDRGPARAGAPGSRERPPAGRAARGPARRQGPRLLDAGADARRRAGPDRDRREPDLGRRRPPTWMRPRPATCRRQRRDRPLTPACCPARPAAVRSPSREGDAGRRPRRRRHPGPRQGLLHDPEGPRAERLRLLGDRRQQPQPQRRGHRRPLRLRRRGRRRQSTNFIFVPAYTGARHALRRPWAAQVAGDDQAMEGGGNIRYDLGAAVVRRDHGRRLQAVVGARGIGFSQPRDQSLRHLRLSGGMAPFDGELEYRCPSTSEGSDSAGRPTGPSTIRIELRHDRRRQRRRLDRRRPDARLRDQLRL